ncbi:PilZ domain-containing protein [Croceicoccus ponticola]|uniref:PilZ domain-containing protein n=1 Tax=Croceicoccus ponticola TaxID=2217664 RepID=A0A437GXC7_9SPHN|nr:PilZ domain-containing protein [Croceicoccus ponticola]RVQ67053.1 PilZ domain-containing protein [Croceicoccus ponticola]
MNDLSQAQFASVRPALDFGRKPERMPIIRTAKLIFAGGEYPCVLRDISGKALRVKLYGAPLPDDGNPFWLEFGDGDRFEVSLIWVQDDQAGLAFAESNDLLSLIGEKGPFRKRAIRIAVDLPASIKSLGRTIGVVIRDISHEGAQIETPDLFSMDQQLRLDIPALGEVYTKVRWRQNPHYGLAFLETFRFEQIAVVAANLQAISQGWRDRAPVGVASNNVAA